MPEPTTICRECAFATERLIVREWHSFSESEWQGDLVHTVTEMLTEETLRPLPTQWRGAYDTDRAQAWIAELDRHGPTLLMVEAATRTPVGLFILFEPPGDDRSDIEVRLGYLIAEPAWGKGFATEAITGFVDWCRRDPRVSAIGAGVERENVASRRVLEKAGFVAQEDEDGDYWFRMVF